jgi:hypothetical protein
MKHFTSLVVLASFALALAGCSKHSSDAAANSKDLNLGVIEVSDGIQSRHDLGDGRVCIITPTIQKDGSVVLDARFEEAGKLLASPRPRVQTVSGRPASFFYGNISFELTPHIKGSAAHFEERQAADDKDTVLPGRHMSEHQVVEIASKELPQNSALKCEFRDGVWEILEVQKGVWGVSSVITNADGKVFITSTNATRVVLRVRDVDGKVEQVKTP